MTWWKILLAIFMVGAFTACIICGFYFLFKDGFEPYLASRTKRVKMKAVVLTLLVEIIPAAVLVACAIISVMIICSDVWSHRWWQNLCWAGIAVFVLPMVGFGNLMEISGPSNEKTYDFYVIGILIFGTILTAGYVTAAAYLSGYFRSTQFQEILVKRTVLSYLKENSNDDKVQIVSWEDFHLLGEKEGIYHGFSQPYTIKVTVRLTNEQGATVLKSFLFHLQRSSRWKAKVIEFKVLKSGSVLCLSTSPNAPPYIGVTSEAA